MTTEDQVLAAANHLIDAFGRHDAEAYFAAFSEDATFIFHNHPVRLEGRREWQDLWRTWESEGFEVLGCHSTDQLVQVLSDAAAVFSHSVRTEARFGDETGTTLERETIVFRLVDGDWLAVHEHLSPASNEASVTNL